MIQSVKLLCLVIAGLLTFDMAHSQSGDFFSVSEAYKQPDKVKALIINLDYQAINDLPEDVDTLRNLEELIFFPAYLSYKGRTEYPPFSSQEISDEESSASQAFSALHRNDSIGIKHLPESIGNLTKLRRIEIAQIPIASLPDSFIHLRNLEELQMDLTAINFDKEFEKLVALPKLKLLSIVGCQATPAKVEEYRKKRPDVEVIYTLEDADHFESKEQEKDILIELQLHDVYYILYKNDLWSERLLKSMPEDIQKQVAQTIVERDRKK